MMNKPLLLCAVATIFPIVCMADTDFSYICKLKSQQRTITVVYDYQQRAVPCEVIYKKSGSITSLWQAKNNVGFCEEKAAGFAEKQAQWGWVCNRQDEQSGEPSS